MATLKDEIQEVIANSMARQVGGTEVWDSVWLSGDGRDASERERIDMLIRWNEGLHAGLVRLAEVVESLRSSSGRG